MRSFQLSPETTTPQALGASSALKPKEQCSPPKVKTQSRYAI
jgi:hypothetical protein